jgi:hypothetical protein
VLGIDPEQVWIPNKHLITVNVIILLCYREARKLGFTTTKLCKKHGISLPRVGIREKREEMFAKPGSWNLLRIGKL